MAYHIYAHDQGCVDYVDSHSTKRAALAHISNMQDEMRQHPSWFDLVAPWFEISNQPPQRETYDFTSMAGVG